MPIRGVVSRLCKHLSLKDLPYRPCVFFFSSTLHLTFEKIPFKFVNGGGLGEGVGGGGGG